MKLADANPRQPLSGLLSLTDALFWVCEASRLPTLTRVPSAQVARRRLRSRRSNSVKVRRQFHYQGFVLNVIDTLRRSSVRTMPGVMKTSRFLLRGFRRPREIACFALGKLRAAGAPKKPGELGEVSVRDIYRDFDERVAYTTLMTTLDRLFKKNLLERRKDGRAVCPCTLCFSATRS